MRATGDLAAALLIVLAVGQVVSGALSGILGNAFTTADRVGEPPIVPAGYTFSIWGLIEAFSVAFAVWAFFTRRWGDDGADRRVLDELIRPLLVVFAGFSAWIAAAELEPVWATLVVFVVMGFALLRALAVLRNRRAVIAGWSTMGRALTYGTIGLYSGWSSIAIWLNLTTALAGSGAPIDGTVGVVGQLAVLAGATATAVVLLWWTGGLLPFAAAVCWAFVGAVLGTVAAGQAVLAVAAGSGLIIVALATLIIRRRLPGRTTAG